MDIRALVQRINGLPRSVWRRIQDGTIRAPGRKNLTLRPFCSDALLALGKNYEAGLALLVVLTVAHPRGGTFAISATAMAKAESVPGRRDRKWYMRTTKALVRGGLLERIQKGHFGGRSGRPNRAAQYRFARFP